MTMFFALSYIKKYTYLQKYNTEETGINTKFPFALT